jgi:sortase (surface protein transpeptidase)
VKVRAERRVWLPAALVTGAVAVASLAVVLGAGATTVPSSRRVLPPPPVSSGILAPPPTAPATTTPLVSSPTVSGPATSKVTAPTKTDVNLSGASVPAVLPAPTGLAIPAIGLVTSVVPLGRNADGSAQVPTGFTFAGWYDLGPKPGQTGPAVILGHVDSTNGPAVFFRLKSLLPGDVVAVHDGSVTVSFQVRQVVTYAKDHFPTATVFGATPDAELRLITCGGPFDRSIGHYEDNIVVYAMRIG